MVSKRLQTLAADLRERMPQLVQEDEDGETSMAMQSHLRFLDDMAYTFDPFTLSRRTKMYPCVTLIETVCLSDMLRHAENLRENIARALPLVLLH